MSTGPIGARPDVDAILSRMRDLRAQARSGAPGEVGPAADVPERRTVGALRARLEAERTAQAAGEPPVPAGAAAPASGPAAEFQSVFTRALDRVNELGHASGAAKKAFLRGEDVDLGEVMVAAGKADVAFKATTEVRNRLVSAYEDIMNMPI